MADPLVVVADLLAPAFAEVAGRAADPVVRPSDRADAQANGALALAKELGRAPRDVAVDVVAAAADSLAGVADLEVAGPGFINVTFTPAFVAGQVAGVAADDHLGVRPAVTVERVVVDYSAPNVAKEMHVGHLRTTVIGDALVRMLGFVGHEVIRENHLGDWGTPFGMLIEHLVDVGGVEGAATLDVRDLDAFYKAARAKFDADDEFKERARSRVVLLQSRDDAETAQLWQALVDQSTRHFNELYGKLGILLTDDDLAGESIYQPMMPEVLTRLDQAGLLQESDGAKVVWVPGYTNREGEPLPLIVQARTGGFNYATSDLACVIDRVERLDATLLVYVIGTPQAQHLQMVWKVAEMAGWLQPPARAVHVNFGNVLGADRKMLKSRSGDPMKFIDLVDEAIERGRVSVAERSRDLPVELQAEVGNQIGVGALKYAELSTDRIKDYVFDWDRMLAFEGNTGPYLQYAHARICSIFRRAEVDRASVRGVEPQLDLPQERALALKLLAFDGALAETLERYAPHRLCTYLFELAQDFTAFYEACPILRADNDEQRTSRLALADLTARVLACGLDLLGIAAPERM
ncbi:MAG: arginine--tRNA ligase [Actinomycetota bacterium]